MGLFLTFRLRINRQHKTGSGKKGLFRNCGAVQNGIKWNARWTSLVCAMLAASGFMLVSLIDLLLSSGVMDKLLIFADQVNLSSCRIHIRVRRVVLRSKSR